MIEDLFEDLSQLGLRIIIQIMYFCRKFLNDRIMNTFFWILIVAGLLCGVLACTSKKSESGYNYNDWFQKSQHISEQLLAFLSKMQNNTELCSFVESQIGAVLRLNGKTITEPCEKLSYLIQMDLVKCYKIMDYKPSDIDKRSIPMFLFYSKLTDAEVNITLDKINTYKTHCGDTYCKIMNQLTRSVLKSSDIFFVAEYLKYSNKELLTEYVQLLLKFGYAVAGAKGKVSNDDNEALNRVFNYLRDSACI